jgi:hypothetical protein
VTTVAWVVALTTGEAAPNPDAFTAKAWKSYSVDAKRPVTVVESPVIPVPTETQVVVPLTRSCTV